MKKHFLRCFAVLVAALLALGVSPVVSLADWYPDDKLAAVSGSYGRSELKAEPVGVTDVKSSAAAESLKTDKPAAAILSLDEDMNVVSSDNEIICTLSVALDEYLKKDILPILNIGGVTEAEKLISWFKTEREIFDVSVMSKNAEAVKVFKTAYPFARGIIEFDETADVKQIVKIANKNGANVVVLPESIADVKTVRYIQGRFKTVWVRAESDSESSIKNSIFSGAYGVIAGDTKKLSDIIAGLSGLTRLPFNVAHRGLPNEYNENSVSGTLAAIEAGATHLELDCYLTTDGEIVFMHDAGLQRTSTGTGNIENYSSEQLKEFRLKQFTDEAIPTFKDIVDAIKGTGTVLILEIKSQKTEIVNALKEKLEGSGIEDDIVVITFHESQLQAMKEVLPEIPTADLNGKTSDTLKDILQKSGENNAGIDYNFNALDEDKIKGLIVRGFIPWTWTYSSEYDVVIALEDGFTGLTNNAAQGLKDKPLYIDGQSKTYKIPEKGGDIGLVVTEYGGATKNVVGKITDVTQTGEKTYEVFAEYTPDEYYLSAKFYTQKFTVTVTDPEPESNTSAGGSDSGSGESNVSGSTTSSGGCGSGLNGAFGFTAFAVIGLFASAVIALKLIKGTKND